MNRFRSIGKRQTQSLVKSDKSLHPTALPESQAASFWRPSRGETSVTCFHEVNSRFLFSLKKANALIACWLKNALMVLWKKMWTSECIICRAGIESFVSNISAWTALGIRCQLPNHRGEASLGKSFFSQVLSGLKVPGLDSFRSAAHHI